MIATHVTPVELIVLLATPQLILGFSMERNVLLWMVIMSRMLLWLSHVRLSAQFV